MQKYAPEMTPPLLQSGKSLFKDKRSLYTAGEGAHPKPRTEETGVRGD